jgi:GT2 family glycosyltransferase
VRYQTAAAINAVTPPGATVIPAGWGGRETSKLIFGRNLRYLPQTSQGGYVARHPSSSEAVLAQLEALRADGAEFAVFSAETLWWEEAYPAFWTYLERRYPRVWGLDQSARVYALKDRTTLPRRAWELDFDAGIREFRARADRDPAILDWADGIVTAAFPELAVFSPPDDATRLPYLPDSVDIVAVGAGRDRADARRVASAAVIVLEPLPDGSPSVTVEWTRQPRRRRSVTSASVVIPSWNGIEHTEKCVLALSETLPTDYDCEIVVVDDASTDDTPQRLAHLAKHEPRLRVIRNEKNSGFIVTCNRGAQESRGEFVIMLNNDTVPLPGWLEPLLAIFRHYPDAGAATGKLLFPDGSVQEAGGIVFSDARAANFGKWDVDNDCPLYNYVREVDYGSGALLALPRSLWNELGGFDLRYRPIYCDDSDLCFKIRQRGLRVYFQPECKVVHVEGATSGRDESTGDKRYQAINRKKFARRWAKELRRQPPYPAGFERPTLHSIVVRDEVDITMGTPS